MLHRFADSSSSDLLRHELLTKQTFAGPDLRDCTHETLQNMGLLEDDAAELLAARDEQVEDRRRWIRQKNHVSCSSS